MALNISKFLNQFFMEAEEKLTNIQSHMAKLEENPGNKDCILVIQRDMHTIKGSSRMVGLKEISNVAHQMEEAFLQLSSNRVTVTENVMHVLYRGIDSVTRLLEAAQKKEPADADSQVMEELQLLIDGKLDEDTVDPLEDIDSSSAGAPGIVKEHSGKRKMKVDFSVLKKKFSQQIPGKEKAAELTFVPGEEPPQKEVQGETVETLQTAETAEPTGQPEPDVRAVELAGSDTYSPDKPHLKVDSGQVETIINQVTDLLSKRYFFNNVLQINKELSQLGRGMREQWQRTKINNINRDRSAVPIGKDRVGVPSDKNHGPDDNLENLGFIDNTVDLMLKKIQEFERDYQFSLTNFENLLRDTYDNLLDLKLTPLSTIFNIYPRFARDYAHRTGKKIRIYIRGGDTQLDKTVIEKINEPLIHIIRNACDHGIELPQVREKQGKPATGTVIIEALKKGNHVQIVISDDGKGLDKDLILDKAVAKKMLDEKLIKRLDEQEIYDFIFQPGFSTASQVTDTSGRGIGMDIVKKVTHQFGGSISIESKKGEGTTFYLEFPVSIFTNQVIYIRDEGNTYAVPGNLIRSIVKLKPSDIKEKSDYMVVVYQDEIYTVAKLNQVLKGETSGFSDASVFMLLPKVTDKKIGIIVDEILHESEVIVKDLGAFLGKRKFVYGMVIGERGELRIVLDVHDIISSGEFSRKIKIIKAVHSEDTRKRCILVVDDSLLVREMEKNLLESAGYEVVTAINGLDGYNQALSRKYDLVLADIEMPEMDGFEMIENIKKITEYADVPTIVLSTVEREEDKIRGINLGVNAWLQKQDFNDSEILKVIHRFIG